ncbi:ATP synthase F1 subunit delta [Taibaiella sp. KBW10]|uniref:ATP synthase F1 subunit delta n=1 Tax=Taibaiella sp. KBW10 TaxID=2153357 RepID=UPI000F5AE7FE|nr:ATP synthase F1 subunit delta [Taibaiella sp. KBW10]RQO31270.1 ATP synthase F1 subunit delta [Taibaiella sp. KBW10]
MPNPRLASRYAKSLLDLAKEQNNVEAVLSDIKTIQNALENSREFQMFLQSPLVKGDKKVAIINAIFADKISPLSAAFLALVVKKGRETELSEIASAFIAQYQELNNIQTVHITTAYPLDAATLEVLSARIKQSLGNDNVIYKTIIDPSILGGFKLQVGDKYFDMSISRDLTDIKNQFTKNVFVADI